jgi:hypothetical protein
MRWSSPRAVVYRLRSIPRLRSFCWFTPAQRRNTNPVSRPTKKAHAMKQFALTPAAGKRLIGKATAQHPAVQTALQAGTLVIVAGTTNGYVAEEILTRLGAAKPFDRRRFFRGVTLPPVQVTTATGRLPDESGFPGDVVIVNGQWQSGQTIFDVADNLKEGDVILKGANALDLPRRKAAILIGGPKGGTIGVALQAAVGRRVRLILPVGLEKRVSDDLDELARRLNAPGGKGLRLLPVPAEVLTELDAIAQLTGASAELVAGGGVGGAEGSVWLVATGTPEQEEAVDALVKSVSAEPLFTL